MNLRGCFLTPGLFSELEKRSDGDCPSEFCPSPGAFRSLHFVEVKAQRAASSLAYPHRCRATS